MLWCVTIHAYVHIYHKHVYTYVCIHTAHTHIYIYIWRKEKSSPRLQLYFLFFRRPALKQILKRLDIRSTWLWQSSCVWDRNRQAGKTRPVLASESWKFLRGRPLALMTSAHLFQATRTFAPTLTFMHVHVHTYRYESTPTKARAQMKPQNHQCTACQFNA